MRVESLFLKGDDLRGALEHVGAFAFLERLELESKVPVALPDRFADLSFLLRLDAERCPVFGFPSVLGKLPRLRELKLEVVVPGGGLGGARGFTCPRLEELFVRFRRRWATCVLCGSSTCRGTPCGPFQPSWATFPA